MRNPDALNVYPQGFGSNYQQNSICYDDSVWLSPTKVSIHKSRGCKSAPAPAPSGRFEYLIEAVRLIDCRPFLAPTLLACVWDRLVQGTASVLCSVGGAAQGTFSLSITKGKWD